MASNDEVFVCSCREELKTKDDVDRHEIYKNWKRGHDKELICQFPDCEKVSSQTSNAKRHWRSKHVPARLSHYFCTKCGVGYAKADDLTAHVKALDCRPKHQKRRRRTSGRDAAPSSPPPVRQTAASFLDPFPYGPSFETHTSLLERLGPAIPYQDDAMVVEHASEINDTDPLSASSEALQKHQAAAVCRKNRKRCRSTSDHDVAPSSPPAIRRTATSFLDPQADDRSPPHPEQTSNNTGPLSSSSTAPHAAELNRTPPKSPLSPPTGSFTLGISRHLQRELDTQQDLDMLPTDRRAATWTVQVSGVWTSLTIMYQDLLGETRFWPTHGPYIQRQWTVLVDQLLPGHNEFGFLKAMFAMHAESPSNGNLDTTSTWSISIEWTECQLTCHWKIVSVMRHTGEMFGINRIFLTDENIEPAAFYDSIRERRLGMFHGDPVAVPSITSQNDVSSTGGPAAESQPPSEVPSNDISQPFTATASSPATGSADSTRPNHPFRWPTPHRNLVDEQSRTDNITRSVSPPSALRSPVTHGSSLLPATPLHNVSNMSRPRGTSESLDPSSAAYPQGNGTEWLGMGTSYRVHQKSPSDQLPDISSAHNPPYMQRLGSSDRSSSMLDPSASADPAFSDGLGLGHFSLNDPPHSQNFYSPKHSPATSPNDGIRQQQEEETAQADFQVSDNIHDHHLTMRGPFPCNVCGMSFNGSRALIRHEKTRKCLNKAAELLRGFTHLVFDCCD
jgi:hypothetical protein